MTVQKNPSQAEIYERIELKNSRYKVYKSGLETKLQIYCEPHRPEP